MIFLNVKEGISMEIFWTSKNIYGKVDSFDSYWKRSGSIDENWWLSMVRDE